MRMNYSSAFRTFHPSLTISTATALGQFSVHFLVSWNLQIIYTQLYRSILTNQQIRIRKPAIFCTKNWRNLVHRFLIGCAVSLYPLNNRFLIRIYVSNILKLQLEHNYITNSGNWCLMSHLSYAASTSK